MAQQPDVVTPAFPVPVGQRPLQPLLHLQEHLSGMADSRACASGLSLSNWCSQHRACTCVGYRGTCDSLQKAFEKNLKAFHMQCQAGSKIGKISGHAQGG